MSLNDKTAHLGLPYPLDTDVMSEFPSVSKEQMMILDGHTHQGMTGVVDDLVTRLGVMQDAINALKNKKYVRGGLHRNVSQTANVGFTLSGVVPERTIVSVQSAGVDEKNRLFCYYNSASKKFVIVRVAVNAAQGKAATTIPGGKFNIIYFTEQ